jgi:hypothetical protein
VTLKKRIKALEARQPEPEREPLTFVIALVPAIDGRPGPVTEEIVLEPGRPPVWRPCAPH